MWQEHTDLRAVRYLQSCKLVDLLSFMEFLAPEDSSSLSSTLQSLPRTIVNILQERDLPPSVLLEFEGKLDCKRFRRYWTSEYGLWLYTARKTNLQVRHSENAATEAFTNQQQDMLHDLEDWPPAEMCRVIADYWNLGDHWTYWTQQLAAEMLSMLAPGLGYNMQSSSWKDATGDTAEHIADAEAEDSIAYALRATQGPQQLLNLLEGSELVRYFCEKAPDMPAAHALLHESPSHAFATKLILAMWRDHQGNPKGCLKELVEREQQAVHSRQLQDERRGRHAHAALQTLLQDLERNAQVEDPQRTWQLGSASADDVMGAVRHFLQQMAPEELRCLLMRMNCTTIEMDDAALQSEHGREAAIGWVLRCPDCTPESLLHSSMCSALQNYLLGVTSNDAWLALPESACIKAILEIWGRSRSGEHVRKQGNKRRRTSQDMGSFAAGTNSFGAPFVGVEQHKDTVLQCLHASALVSEANLGFCCKDTSQ